MARRSGDNDGGQRRRFGRRADGAGAEAASPDPDFDAAALRFAHGATGHAPDAPFRQDTADTADGSPAHAGPGAPSDLSAVFGAERHDPDDHAASPAVSGAQDSWADERRQLIGQIGELRADAQGHREEREALLAQLARERDDWAHQYESLGNRLDELDRNFEAERRQWSDSLREREDALAEAQRRNEELVGTGVTGQHAADGLAAELADARHALESERVNAESIRAELRGTHNALDAEKATTESLRHELATSRDEQAADRRELHDLRSQLASTRVGDTRRREAASAVEDLVGRLEKLAPSARGRHHVG